MAVKIDFYYRDDSSLFKDFKNLKEFDSQFQFNYINQKKDGFKTESVNIILFEEESFITSIDLYEKIIKLYKNKVIPIILSNNGDVYNVVQWMRKGAVDYILLNDLTSKIINFSINKSIEFVDKKNNNKSGKSLLKDNSVSVTVPDNFSWKIIKNNHDYDMSIIMFEILLTDTSIERYSKISIDNIYAKLINEASKIAQSFGGKLWYWGNNSGALVFLHDNKVNCSVLSAISFFNNFFSFCISKLKLDELLDIKIAAHHGNGLFNMTNTDQITSDLINSLAHLINIFTKKNNFNITEDVFENLHPRLKKHFNRGEEVS